MTALLDANVLIAVTQPDHVHYLAAGDWLARWTGKFATCPVTEGALVRSLLRRGGTQSAAKSVLDGLTGSGRHEFWPDDLPYEAVDLTGVIGHRQVTDAYLAALARARNARLATLDRGLAALHPDVAELIERT